MTRSIALSLLSKGNTGTEILKILDVIATEEAEQPTIDVIEFWWYNLLSGAAVIRGTHTIRLSSYSWWQYVAPWRLCGRRAKRL